MDKGDNDLPSRYYTVYYSSIPHLLLWYFTVLKLCLGPSPLAQPSSQVSTERQIGLSTSAQKLRASFAMGINLAELRKECETVDQGKEG